MILPLHIVIALLSIIISIVAFFKPSQRKIVTSYIFAGMTVVSGTLLIILLNVSILHTCITGLGYLAVTMGATLLARRKLLATQEI
jgi:uncharacterized membrane protein YgdD (TMEM256/DUF423 family)